MSQPQGYVDSEYLRRVAEIVKRLKQRTYELMQIEPGQRLLDVGCGPASDTVELAKLVGTGGEVVGVDHDPAMLREADERARQAGVSAWVRHQRASSSALPFPSNTFDACRSERLFQHLADPSRTLAEMVRVTKPGGRIVVLDTDWGSASVDALDVDIERRLARAQADNLVVNGYAGRQLYRLFKLQRIANIHVEVHTNWSTSYAVVREATLLDRSERIAVEAGILTEAEAQCLRSQLEQADADGVYFASMNQVLVAGMKA